MTKSIKFKKLIIKPFEDQYNSISSNTNYNNIQEYRFYSLNDSKKIPVLEKLQKTIYEKFNFSKFESVYTNNKVKPKQNDITIKIEFGALRIICKKNLPFAHELLNDLARLIQLEEAPSEGSKIVFNNNIALFEDNDSYSVFIPANLVEPFVTDVLCFNNYDNKSTDKNISLFAKIIRDIGTLQRKALKSKLHDVSAKRSHNGIPFVNSFIKDPELWINPNNAFTFEQLIDAIIPSMTIKDNIQKTKDNLRKKIETYIKENVENSNKVQKGHTHTEGRYITKHMAYLLVEKLSLDLSSNSNIECNFVENIITRLAANQRNILNEQINVNNNAKTFEENHVLLVSKLPKSNNINKYMISFKDNNFNVKSFITNDSKIKYIKLGFSAKNASHKKENCGKFIKCILEQKFSNNKVKLDLQNIDFDINNSILTVSNCNQAIASQLSTIFNQLGCKDVLLTKKNKKGINNNNNIDNSHYCFTFTPRATEQFISAGLKLNIKDFKAAFLPPKEDKKHVSFYDILCTILYTKNNIETNQIESINSNDVNIPNPLKCEDYLLIYKALFTKIKHELSLSNPQNKISWKQLNIAENHKDLNKNLIPLEIAKSMIHALVMSEVNIFKNIDTNALLTDCTKHLENIKSKEPNYTNAHKKEIINSTLSNQQSK